MTLATEKSRITAEQFMVLPDAENYELIDGQLVERKEMGVRASHVAARISSKLFDFSDGGQLGWVLDAETTFQCFGNPNTLRRSDVSFVRRGRFPDEKLPEGYCTIPPDLAVEVVSPTNSAYEVDEKVTQYLKNGFQVVWVVYPLTRSVYIHRPGRDVVRLEETDEITGDPALPGFRCNVSKFFPPPE